MSKKISQLSGATSVSGSDLTYIVQGGTSKSATINQLIAAAPHRPQIVTTRNAVPNSRRQGTASGRTDTRSDNRRKMFVGNAAVSQLRMAFPGYYVLGGTGEQLLGNDYTIEAAFELTSPATYSTAYTQSIAIGVVTNGIGYVITDPLVGFDIAAGGSFYIRTSMTIANDTLYLPSSTAPVSASGDAGWLSSAGSSLVSATGSMSSPSGGASWGACPPCLLLGIPASPMPAVAILGDSIADGTGDSSNSLGSLGFITRGLESVVSGNPVPYVRQTVGSDTFAKNTLDISPRKRALWPYVTHLFVQLGTNDITSNSSNLAAMQTFVNTVCTAAKRTVGPYGKPLQTAVSTLMPRTTSTDSWATAGNQTPVSGMGVGQTRDTYNAWLKTQVGNGVIDAVVDVNPYVEDQSNPGKWITNGSANYPTTDGVHPTSALHVLAAQAVSSWAAGIVP